MSFYEEQSMMTNSQREVCLILWYALRLTIPSTAIRSVRLADLVFQSQQFAFLAFVQLPIASRRILVFFAKDPDILEEHAWR